MRELPEFTGVFICPEVFRIISGRPRASQNVPAHGTLRSSSLVRSRIAVRRVRLAFQAPAARAHHVAILAGHMPAVPGPPLGGHGYELPLFSRCSLLALALAIASRLSIGGAAFRARRCRSAILLSLIVFGTFGLAITGPSLFAVAPGCATERR